MENKLALKALAPASPVVASPAPPASTSNSAKMQADAVDLRLVIEEDSVSGLFVYKTVNRRTGDVLLQLPRDEVLRMHATGAYIAGAIIDAKA